MKSSVTPGASLIAVVAVLAGCAAGMQQGYLFVGGKYVERKGGSLMERQMYVEYRIPDRPKQRYPIVMIHGSAATGTSFTGTPDGRQGWAQWFAEQGYAVYVVDQPTRGRSAWNQSVGPLIRLSASHFEKRFTATAKFKLWPQAARHTQWPGEGPKKGLRGDPAFDQFYASQVQYIADPTINEPNVRNAVAALLDKIGPAIVLTHSQAGSFGWGVADERPRLVKAIVAVEPSGPPFRNAVFDETPARPWGITSTPMRYDPPVTRPKELERAEQASPDGPDLARCVLQAEPARKLVALQGMPVLIFTGEASYHAVYDHCTAKFLTQAGARVEYVRLESVGIRGNGHMVMVEKNNLEIAEFVHGWLVSNLP